jgi:hypothetical protein
VVLYLANFVLQNTCATMGTLKDSIASQVIIFVCF